MGNKILMTISGRPDTPELNQRPSSLIQLVMQLL